MTGIPLQVNPLLYAKFFAGSLWTGLYNQVPFWKASLGGAGGASDRIASCPFIRYSYRDAEFDEWKASVTNGETQMRFGTVLIKKYRRQIIVD